MGKGNFSTPFGADSDQYVNRSLTQAQRDYLMAGLDAEDELQARLALILWLGFGCGLRSAEMIGLSFSDLLITPERWSLKVKGKGKKNRTVPLSTPVKNAIHELHGRHRVRSGIRHPGVIRTGCRERWPAHLAHPKGATQARRRREKAGIDSQGSDVVPDLEPGDQKSLRSQSPGPDRKRSGVGGTAGFGVDALAAAFVCRASRYLVEEDEVLADAMEAFLAPNGP